MEINYLKSTFNEDNINNKDMTIVMFKQSDIKAFSDKSTPNAPYSEYQCHYFAVVQQIHTPNGRLNLVYPLMYYNYYQEVSSARIDTEFKYISKMAKEIYPYAKSMFDSLIIQLENIRSKSKFSNMETNYIFTIYNNIHKHP